MNRSLKRFAWRIVLVHAALLLPLLLLVFAAAHEVYHSTHDQAQKQVQKQQELLASQTASGLKGYYDSIFSDLELFKPVDPDAEDVDDRTTEDQAFLPPTPPSNGIPGRRLMVPRSMPPQMRTLRDVLPLQLSGRVSHLFVVYKDGSNNPNRLGPQSATPTLQEVAAKNRDWLESVERPSFISLEQFTGSSGDVRGLSVIGVPLGNGASRSAVLIATVPVRQIAKRFFDEVNQSGDNAIFLLDEQLTCMSASKSDRIGGSIDDTAAAKIRELSGTGEDGSGVIRQPFTMGARTFKPSIITVDPVKVLDKQWYVVLVQPQADVDTVVAALFHKTLLWAVFVGISIAAILVSTAIQIIRNRARSERERHELLEKELRQAREIQLHWLPQPRANDGILDIATINQPASRISGDFYNWFDLPGGRTAVVIGDVTGHGMAAAFLMATTQLLVRNTLPLTEDPGRCLEEINRQLCTQIFNGQFVTLQILILDPTAGTVEIASAGHPFPILSDKDTLRTLVMEPNLVLGVDPSAQYATETFPLHASSTLLLYTDGVVDAESRKSDRFGADRLRDAVRQSTGDAAHLVRAIVKSIDQFRSGQPLSDDLTMVAIQLQPRWNHVAAAPAQPLESAVV
jgi:serine phosphatase RsbU (regulator of sigma subunit)